MCDLGCRGVGVHEVEPGLPQAFAVVRSHQDDQTAVARGRSGLSDEPANFPIGIMNFPRVALAIFAGASEFFEGLVRGNDAAALVATSDG